jgi:hypothetical protein
LSVPLFEDRQTLGATWVTFEPVYVTLQPGALLG